MIQGLTAAIKESWILKGFLGLLMMSFAVWGVGDAINPAVDPNVVIKVDQVDIRVEELQRRFNTEVEQLREALGPDFSARDAVDLGIMDNIVSQLSQRASLDMAAREMGIAIPDALLRRAVMEQDTFKDETGNFNRILLNAVLSNNRLTEQDFVDLLRSDITRQVLLQPVAANAGAPKTMVDALFRYRAEQRMADVLYIADSEIQLDAEPGEADLRQVYDENISSFTAPEYRTVEAIMIRPTDLVPRDSISQDEIQTFYDENMDRYRTQATRTVRQLIFPTELDARTAYDQLQDGDTLVELGERLSKGSPIDLGALKANDNIGFDLSAIFDLTQKVISAPVQTDFGWHLFEVTDLTTGSISALPVVQEDIIDFIVNDRAFEEMYQATIYLEDQLAAGMTVSEVAETPGYSRIYFETVDRDGRDTSGARLTFPVEQDRFLRLAFSTPVGLDSELIETEEIAYILRVTAIIEPAPRPYDRVTADVRSLWEKQARAAATQAKALALLDDIGPSVEFPVLAESNDSLEFANLGPVTRFGDSLRIDNIIAARLVSPALMELLFKESLGDVMQARVAAGHVVARLVEVIPPNETDLAQIREQVAEAVRSSLANDLVAEFTDSITRDFDVVLNRETINQLAPE
jgi:peptidyl-prolyl cis-trans isomerase D